MIEIAECGTGVVNVVFDDGCTMADELLACEVDVRNHGDYVTCVTEIARGWKSDGLISGNEFGSIVSCAGKSNPRRGGEGRPDKSVWPTKP